MQGDPGAVTSADGTRIAFTTGGAGPPLLLVHGGMCSATRWAPLWPRLTGSFSVTAMDRRGRGTSGDGVPSGYSIEAEYDDVAAVCAELASRHRTSVDVFGHSYGAVCALGAAARGATVNRLVLYEPPGPQTVADEWLDEARVMIARGQLGQALFRFLVDVVGLSPAAVHALRDQPRDEDPLQVVANTLVREAEALTAVDLPGMAAQVSRPVHLLLGSTSPPWAAAVTSSLAAQLRTATTVVLPRHGHEAVDTAPRLVAAELVRALFPAC